MSIGMVRGCSVCLEHSSEILIMTVDWMVILHRVVILSGMVQVVSLNVVVLDPVRRLRLYDLPQLVVVMLQISHEVLPSMSLDVVGVVVIGHLNNDILVIGSVVMAGIVVGSRCMVVRTLMVEAMLWICIIVVHTMVMDWVGTVMGGWTVVVKCLHIVVLNPVRSLALNNLPQIIVIVLKVTYQVLSVVLIDIVIVVVVGGLRYDIMMHLSMVVRPTSKVFFVTKLGSIPHWSAFVSPIRSLSTREAGGSAVVWVLV